MVAGTDTQAENVRDASATRARLLRAAEQRFASKGIDNTSVRDVNALAGQRNTSAIRYHFGGMRGLLEALIEERMGALDQARAEALDLLELRAGREASKEKGGDEVERLVAVLILPLAERVETDEAWACWVRVLAQLISVRGAEHRSFWEGRLDHTTRAVFQQIRTRLPADLPERVWQQRLADLMLLCIVSLCERVEREEKSPSRARLEADAYADNLVTTATALLRAPF